MSFKPSRELVNFNNHAVQYDKKVSHLHDLKAHPDPNGNRAERRRYKKLYKKEK